ncbi:hypothetical protein AAE02nite_22640 [Adhaeribacter aerolatus]|uniref:Uncharacterized protein n=1 Tax=Adhaeribacter aerolatus TaxID=670289 RepID=A0A512AY35_9BACT|nr:hypothetical protein [Adhaeribacter aerolatus]GEO04600.1 hypothetical protein AAE02nite_22640 [Adhaeribacter aerolatus]
MAASDAVLEIPVTYRGEELVFPAQVLMTGYTHKIQVDIDGQFIMFEPDEERNYRAVLDQAQLEKGARIDIELLQAIARVLESVVK